MVQDRLELDTTAGPCMGQVDWQVEICWLYWPLNGPEWSRDLDTGLWLVQNDHMTWILASDWCEWSHELNTGLWLVQSDHMTWILASYWSIVTTNRPCTAHRCTPLYHQWSLIMYGLLKRHVTNSVAEVNLKAMTDFFKDYLYLDIPRYFALVSYILF